MKAWSRRRIATLAVTLAVLFAGLPDAASAQIPKPTLTQRSYVTGKFALILDGAYVGILPAVSGVGEPVVTHEAGRRVVIA